MSEELKAAQARIACLEGEIAKRDARIAEFEEGADKWARKCLAISNENAQLRAELAAIKAQGVELIYTPHGNGSTGCTIAIWPCSPGSLSRTNCNSNHLPTTLHPVTGQLLEKAIGGLLQRN